MSSYFSSSSSSVLLSLFHFFAVGSVEADNAHCYTTPYFPNPTTSHALTGYFQKKKIGHPRRWVSSETWVYIQNRTASSTGDSRGSPRAWKWLGTRNELPEFTSLSVLSVKGGSPLWKKNPYTLDGEMDSVSDDDADDDDIGLDMLQLVIECMYREILPSLACPA